MDERGDGGYLVGGPSFELYVKRESAGTRERDRRHEGISKQIKEERRREETEGLTSSGASELQPGL